MYVVALAPPRVRLIIVVNAKDLVKLAVVMVVIFAILEVNQIQLDIY